MLLKELKNVFFNPIAFQGSISDKEYQDTQFCIDTLEALSRSCNLSIYVIDYYKQNFLYVSSNELFLNGNTVEDIKAMGYAYYQKYLPESDFNFLKKINRAGFRFFYGTDDADRLKYTISYDFHLLKGKRKILVNHKLTPIKLNQYNQVWLAMCVVTLAPKGSKSQTIIINSDSNYKYIFNEITLRWRKIDMLLFSDKEIDILRFSAQGFSNMEIGRMMCLDMNTIKFHKKHIYSKMEVRNISEAVAYATTNKII
ncbi:MAG: transcriptional regulator [Bacteroidetes bacterium]|nr:transcriptional regulator [Bacteroidota bacterium]